MGIGIGIDTGGTYTDAVIVDLDSHGILASAKALTTREDLSLGIGAALDALPPDRVRQAELVSLSTTLATNACVENKGGRARLLLLGAHRKVVAESGRKYGLPPVEEIHFLDIRKGPKGEVLEAPDWDAFEPEARAWLADADALAVVELESMKSADLERTARDLVRHWLDLPVVCGHELFSDLNILQRGAGTLLNARLFPVIAEFLEAIRKALLARSIRAPVVIVRSDGSLMSETFTAARPVETLLCGPAASVAGGLALTREPDAVLVDMGGTTTDIALLRAGSPVRTREGIQVGKWRTFVRGVLMETFGLGGDSAIRFTPDGRLTLGPERVIPLCAAAARWPGVLPRLAAIVADARPHSRMLHEFLCLQKEPAGRDAFTAQELALCQVLADGALPVSEAAAAVGSDHYRLKTDRLEREGIVMRIGLTPTDMMHLKGDFDRFDREAARLGAAYVAAQVGIPEDSLPDRVYDLVRKTLYIGIVRFLLEEADPELRKKGLGHGLERLIEESWHMAADTREGSGRRLEAEDLAEGKPVPFLQFGFRTPAALVGLGAPTHLFLPDVARALGTRCVVPEHAAVANAVGAVTGSVSATREIAIRPLQSDEGGEVYVLYGADRDRTLPDLEEAIAAARQEAEDAALREARARGASGDLSVRSEVAMESVQSRERIDVLLGVTVTATAAGCIARGSGTGI